MNFFRRGGAEPAKRQDSDTYDPLADDAEAENGESWGPGSSEGYYLMDKEIQYWALGIWALVLPLVQFGLHKPISCVDYSEEDMKAPQQCKNLGGSDSLLVLSDFCWQPCFPLLEDLVQASVGLALIVQATVVMLNHDGCSSFLRVRWYFDPSDLFDGEHADEKGEKRNSWMQAMNPVEAFKEWTRKRLTAAGSTKVVPGAILSRISSLCTGNAAALLFCFIGVVYSNQTVFFECDDKDGDTIYAHGKLKQHRKELFSLFAALALMLVNKCLVDGAKWTLQIKFRRQEDRQLRKQFHKHPSDDADVTYFPLQEPEAGYARLKKAFLMALYRVEDSNGALHDPNAEGVFEGNVVLHFRKQQATLTPERLHRMIAGMVIMGAGASLTFAAHSCWVCVDGVRAGKGMSAMHLARHLLLLGACGRHNNLGKSCALAGVFLIIAAFIQAFIFFCTKMQDEQVGDGSLAEDFSAEELLYVKLLDKRRGHAMNPTRYREAGATMESVRSHVWVKKGEHGKEEEVDCTLSFDKKERAQWTRSAQPRAGVTVVDAPAVSSTGASSFAKWRSGLLRSEYNVPKICITFQKKEGGATLTQVVPPEFIAGHIHGWVALGPRVAWEVFSAALVLGAALLATLELVVFALEPEASELTSCRDVLNSECMHLHVTKHQDILDVTNPMHIIIGQGAPIQFRLSSGPFAAAAGIGSALFGAVGLRVAYDARNRPPGSLDLRCRTLCSVLGAYCAALFGGSLRLCSFFCSLGRELCAFAAISCCRRLCPTSRSRPVVAPEARDD